MPSGGLKVKPIEIKKGEGPKSASSSLDSLSPEERDILNRRLEVPAERVPDEEEQKILDERASFQTGLVEKIPSQAWSFENFQQMLTEQEQFYKVPLPRSYKNKLLENFKKSYLPAAEAFKNGDSVQARNLWVESLIFPIYADNIQKHRGVVLTMLRPFISDTLSKIAAINSSLVEAKIREREKVLSENYEKFLQAVKQKSWPEASRGISDLEMQMAEFSKPARGETPGPPYPPSIAQVDQDIRATLFELLNVPPPSTADLEPMRRDLQAKKQVVESFLPENAEKSRADYEEGLRLIQTGNWSGAEEKLQAVRFPLSLAKDAGEKIKILKRLQPPDLDSGRSAG